MSVSSTTAKITYASLTGLVNIFAYNFKINDADHLIITAQTAGQADYVYNSSEYSVSGVGNNAGGNVTMVVAPTCDLLIIERSTPIIQPIVYVQNNAFPFNTHEEALDRLTLICQELQSINTEQAGVISDLTARLEVLEATALTIES